MYFSYKQVVVLVTMDRNVPFSVLQTAKGKDVTSILVNVWIVKWDITVVIVTRRALRTARAAILIQDSASSVKLDIIALTVL